jgi:hypothetical protein
MNFIQKDFDGALAVAKKEFPEVQEAVLKEALTRLIKEGTIPKSPVLTKDAWDRAIALRKQLGDLHGEGSFKDNVDMKFASMASTPGSADVSSATKSGSAGVSPARK